MKTINLETGLPSAKQAMDRLTNELYKIRAQGLPYAKVIHGYGSTGRGGKIRPAVREELEKLKRKKFIKDFIPGEDFGPMDTASRQLADRNRSITRDPDYGEVVCRCQTVTKVELRQAIENPLGVKTIAGIKYRAWATTGRCNGGYCLPRIARMLVEEYGLDPEEVTYRGAGSNLFTGRVK